MQLRSLLQDLVPERAWYPASAKALLELYDRSRADRHALNVLFGRVEEERSRLQALAAQYSSSLRTPGLATDQPVGVLLNNMARSDHLPVLCMRLAGVALELRLRGDRRGEPLFPIVSGMLLENRAGTALLSKIGRVDSLDALAKRYCDLAQGFGSDPPHRGFHLLWPVVGKLIASLVREGALRQSLLEEADTNPWTGFRFEQLEVGADLDPAKDPEDCEGQIGTEPHAERHKGDRRISAEAENGIAKAQWLTRRGTVLACAEPNHLAPCPLLARLVSEASTRAKAAIDQGDFYNAECAIASQLLVVSGCRVRELPRILSGKEPSESCCSVDPDAGLFLRSELRPPKAYTPRKEDRRWRDTGGPVALVLPRTLQEQVRVLLCTRPATDSPILFQEIAKRHEKERIDFSSWLESLMPGIGVGASNVRSRLIAALTESLGPEGAQIAMGDGLGLVATAAYYSRFSAESIALAAWRSTASIFGENPASLPVEVPTHCIGSRTAVDDESIRSGIASLESEAKRRAREARYRIRETWLTYVESAVAALLHGTGVRPTASLHQLHLYDVCPEHGLAMFSDKNVDPAHQVRPAAMGSICLGALQRYLRFLVQCHTRNDQFGKTAGSILRNARPLFSTPEGEGQFDLDALISKISPLHSDRPNLLRHRLNQKLIEAGIDPELRHQQLGWLVIPAYALADLSPVSAATFAGRIESALDKHMRDDGWSLPAGDKEHFWEGIPMPALRDWKVDEDRHRLSQQAATEALRAKFIQRKREILEEIRPAMKNAISRLIPDVRLDSRHWSLEQTNQAAKPVEIGKEVVVVLLDEILGKAEDPVTSLVARAELARILKAAQRQKLVSGFIPSYHKLNFSSQPSPFLRNTGEAVRHAEWIRRFIRSAPLWEKNPSPRAIACRAMLGIVFLTPYRTFDEASAILQGAPDGLRGRGQGDVVRIPTGGGHVVLDGEVALLVSRWRRQARHSVPNQPALSKWLLEHFRELVDADVTAENICERIEGVARTAGRVELSGPERLHLLGAFRLNTVDAKRALGRHENWPSQQSDRSSLIQPPSLGAASPSCPAKSEKQVPRSSGRMRVQRVIRYCNEKSAREEVLPLSLKRLSDGMMNRKGAVREELELMLQQHGTGTDMVAAVTGYALHLLVSAPARKPRELSTVHTRLTRFAKPLVECMENAPLASLIAQDFEFAYSAVLLGKNTKGGRSGESNHRARVYEELQAFHRWLREAHGVEAIQWADLAAIAGGRNDGVDPGLLWEHEVSSVIGQLMADTNEAESNPNCDPATRQLVRQRELFALLLASTDCRPGSIHGLTHADVVLSDEGDWVHLRKGRYGRVKTKTSLGFHPVEGVLWRQHRVRCQAWLKTERDRLGEAALDYPVFGQFHDPSTRHSIGMLGNRLNELLRWATGHPGAHAYWFRKSTVISLHEAIWKGDRPPRALDTYRVLKRSGHAHILTALGSYLHDPDAVFGRYLHSKINLTASNAISLSGLGRSTIESAWQRKSGERSARELSNQEREAAILGSAGFAFEYPPRLILRAAPAMQVKPSELLPRDIATFLSATQRTQQLGPAVTASGCTEYQANRIVEVAEDWQRRTGYGILFGEGPRGSIKRPRRFAAAEPLFGVLEAKELNPAWGRIAQHWMHSARSAPLSAGLPLLAKEDREEARALLRSIGVECQRGQYQDIEVLVPLRTGNARTGLTLWPVLAWVLSVVWVREHLRPLHSGA